MKIEGLIAPGAEDGTPYPACYATPDLAACTGAYLKSDLNGVSWAAVEDEAHAQMARDFMTPKEASAYSEAFKRLEPVSDFDWEAGRAKETGYDDFIHFYVIGVDKNARGCLPPLDRAVLRIRGRAQRPLLFGNLLRQPDLTVRARWLQANQNHRNA